MHRIMRKDSSRSQNRLTVGTLVLDRVRFEVLLGGQEVALTRKQFNLLWLLCSEPGRVFRRDDLLEKLWDKESVEPRTIDAQIVRLRNKLRAGSGHPRI
jgi:two-component system alkaline phosphatase synthesis response regulator PhoP